MNFNKVYCKWQSVFFEDKTNEYGYTVKVVKPHNWLHIGFFIVIIKL